MITYRKADITDIDELLRLRSAFSLEINPKADAGLMQQLKASMLEYFNETIRDDSFVAWLAVEDGCIVGTSGMCFFKLPPSVKNVTGRQAYIMNMYTIPEYRAKGIARALFGKIVEEAVSLGFKKISLHATEMGRPIYEKFGFKATGNEMIFTV